MSFKVVIDGVSDHLTELQGQKDVFYVAEIGTHRELSFGLFYGDETAQFCAYYHRMERADGRLALDFYLATTERFKGGYPILRKAHARVVESNIKKLFQERSEGVFDSPTLKPASVSFSWDLKAVAIG